MRDEPDFTICPSCDLVQRIDPLELGESAYCYRCSEEIACGPSNQFDTVRALLLTSILLLMLMNVFPLVEMSVGGVTRSTTLIGAIYNLYLENMHFLALLVFLTTIVCPSIEVLLLAIIFVHPKIHRIDIPSDRLFRLFHSLRTWGMVEVFMLGILVSLVKLAAFAEIIPGPAIGACVCLIVILASLKRLVRPEQLWRYLEGAKR